MSFPEQKTIIFPEIDWAKLADVSRLQLYPFPKFFYDNLKPILKTRVSCVSCMASTPYKTDYISPKFSEEEIEKYEDKIKEWESMLGEGRIEYSVFRDGKVVWNVNEPPYHSIIKYF